MKKIVSAFLLLATTAVGLGQQAQLTARLDSLMKLYEQEKYFSGVVTVSQKGKLLYGRAFGYADKEKRILNQVNTNFNIASVGKTFTAVMIMQLVQEGKLKLTDTLQSLLPAYNLKNANQITVRHLLTHTSGINNYMAHPRFESTRGSLKSLSDVMLLVADMQPTLASPGAGFDYSNSGFIALGRIIEKVTGKDYMTNLEERIFKKAGIKNSYIHYPATFNAPEEAVPYFVFSNTSYKNATAEEFPAFSDGGMQSNAPDLTRFADGLLKGYLLRADARRELWTPAIPMGRGGSYAYGWIANDNPYNKQIVSHDGGGKGFSTDLKIVVEDEYVIVVMINNRLNPREISNNILKLLYTGKYDKPQKSFEHLAFERIEEKGWTTAREQFPAMLAESGLSKVPSFWTYIRLMEMLADNGKPAIAFDLLQLAVKDFPGEPGPFNAAAQIALATGDKASARKYYEKALQVNPNDEFAKNGLKNVE